MRLRELSVTFVFKCPFQESLFWQLGFLYSACIGCHLDLVVFRQSCFFRLFLVKLSLQTKSYSVGILGLQSLLSFLRYLASNIVSSLISESKTCLLPRFVLGTSTIRSKRLFKPSQDYQLLALKGESVCPSSTAS